LLGAGSVKLKMQAAQITLPTTTNASSQGFISELRSGLGHPNACFQHRSEDVDFNRYQSGAVKIGRTVRNTTTTREHKWKALDVGFC